MKTALDCYPCIVRQSIEAARIAGLQGSDQQKIVDHVLGALLQMDHDLSPPVLGQRIHREIRRISGNPDPYARVKSQFNEQVMKQAPSLRREIRSAEDPLQRALLYAIASNVIDFGANNGPIDVESELRKALDTPFSVYDYSRLSRDLSRAETLVYLGDNAGEIVFDKLFIEELLRKFPLDITFVVRGAPVLNDVTREDAHQVGLDQIVRVVDNGSDAPATVCDDISQELRSQLGETDLILSKGQGNYESLDEVHLPVYFLFKIKCTVTAKRAGGTTGEYVLTRGENFSGNHSP